MNFRYTKQIQGLNKETTRFANPKWINNTKTSRSEKLAQIQNHLQGQTDWFTERDYRSDGSDEKTTKTETLT